MVQCRQQQIGICRGTSFEKIRNVFTHVITCVYLSGCSKIVKLVDDTNSEDNPLSGKSTDERIIMCLNEEYPEHDFDVIESFNKENDSGKFEDENGVEFTVHGLVYDNTYHLVAEMII